MSERSSSVGSASSDGAPLVLRTSFPSQQEMIDVMFRSQNVPGPFVIVGQSIYLRALVSQDILHLAPFAANSAYWYNAGCSMMDLPSPYHGDTPVLISESGRVVPLSSVPVPDHVTIDGQRYRRVDLFAKSIEVNAEDPCAWDNLGRDLRHPCDVPDVPEGEKSLSQEELKYTVTISGEEIGELTAYQRSLALNPTSSIAVINACAFFKSVNVAKAELEADGDKMPESRRAAIAAAVAKDYSIDIDGVTYKTEEALRTLVMRMVPDNGANVVDICRLRGCAVVEDFPEEFLPMPEPGDDFEEELQSRQEIYDMVRAFVSLIAANNDDASLWYALGKFISGTPVCAVPILAPGAKGKKPKWQQVTVLECFQKAVAADPTLGEAYAAIACELIDAEDAEESQLPKVPVMLPKSHVDGDTATRRLFDRNEEKQSVELTAVGCASRAAELAPRNAEAWVALATALFGTVDVEKRSPASLVAFVGQEALPVKACAARAVENCIENGRAWALLARALLSELQAAAPVGDETSAVGKRPRDGDARRGKPQLPRRRPASYPQGSELEAGQIDLTWFHSRRTSPEINKMGVNGIPVAPADGSEPRYHRLAVAEVALRAIELDDELAFTWIVVSDIIDFLQEHPERFHEAHLVTDAFRTQGLTEEMMPQWVFHLAEQTLTRGDVMERIHLCTGDDEEGEEGEEESDEDV